MDYETKSSTIEVKLYNMGTQLRWWGVIIFVAGIITAILMTDACSGIIIATLGFIVALQGALMRYYLKAKGES